jgi:hypothetical protein
LTTEAIRADISPFLSRILNTQAGLEAHDN